MTTQGQVFERFKVEWLLLRDLVPHPVVQREFNQTRAERMASEFDPDKFRTLDVIPYGAKFRVFAGQHRLWAARKALGDDQRVPCRVHDKNLSLRDQARICLGVDDMVAWRALSKWKIRVIEEQEIPVKIEAILKRHHLRIANEMSDGVVRAVNALETIYIQQGEAVLTAALDVLDAAYGKQQDAYDGLLLRGLALFLAKTGTSVDRADLARRMTRYAGPGRLLGAARDLAKVSGISASRGMARRLADLYNRGRRAGLIKWED